MRAGLSVRLAAHLLCQIHLAADDEPQVSAAPAQLLDYHAPFRGDVVLLEGRRLQYRYHLAGSFIDLCKQPVVISPVDSDDR